MTARQLLDQVHSLAKIAELDGDPDRYAQQLATEVPAELEPRDIELAAALGHIDATVSRIMRIRLDHVLANDTAIGPPTRNVFAMTIVGYATDLDLLARRARDVAERGRAADPDRITELVVDAARSTLALRDALRAGVLALIRDLATAAIPEADRQARDRKLDDKPRMRWSAIRRDLEAVAANPEHVRSAPLPARLAALPPQLDEPDPEREPTLAELIELD
jgi:hypothetical protein